MKLSKILLAAFAICTMSACSKHDTLEKQPQSFGDMNTTVTTRALLKENYWARCPLENGQVGQKCTYGGWGCGNNHNTPRCAARSQALLDILDRFSPSDLEFYYSGQLTTAFVEANMSIFTSLYNLGIGDEPSELLDKLNEAGL